MPLSKIKPQYPVDFHRLARTTDEAGGQAFVVRSIQPGDTGLLAQFHATLSDETVRSRYFHYVGLHARIADARLARICRPDPQSEAVLVAIINAPAAPGSEDAATPHLTGVGRLEEMNPRVGEVAVVISDAWQHHGIGRALLESLIQIARDRGLSDLHAYILPENLAMQRLCHRQGFTMAFSMNMGAIKAHLSLASAA